ncbi:MAG: hypothetical protein NTX65_00005 [Ignavibacteriales bacterium]|nr:hypothetical protein [Ignavibacteriales bacterium]
MRDIMFLSGLFIYVSLFIVLMAILMKSAPVGFENDLGFHYGNKLNGEPEEKKAA